MIIKDASEVEEYLDVPKFRKSKIEKVDLIGLSHGLAWTETGGDVLSIEAILMRGKGNLSLTGKLGDVMQESGQAAMSYIKSRAGSFGIDNKVFSKIDCHVHVPEGAIPKDGPSAGITIATAIVSAFTRIPVRSDVAMTGEVTLRGRVLPIGGLKEKILAAHRFGIKRIILPKENEIDLKEVPEEIRKDLEFIGVENMDDVMTAALAKEIKPLADVEELLDEVSRDEDKVSGVERAH
jgi:ATP-dependent Lon protease